MRRDHPLFRTVIHRQRRMLRLAAFAGICFAVSAIGLLAISGWFLTGAALAGMTGAALAFNYLLPSAAIRLFAILRTVARYAERLASHAAALRALAALRTQLFSSIAAKPPSESLKLSIGDTAARLGQDVSALEDAFIRKSAVPTAAAGIFMMVLMTWATGWLAMLGALASFAGCYMLTRWRSASCLPPRAETLQRRLGDSRRQTTEMLSARAEIIAYGLTEQVTDQLTTQLSTVDDARLALAEGEAWIAALPFLGATIACGWVVYFSTGMPILTGLGAFATLAAFEPFSALLRGVLKAPHVNAGIQRLEALAVESTSEEGPGQLGISDSPTLGINGINLPPGGRLLISGPSGAGKTRIALTLAGLRDAAPQSLFIDGIAASAIPPKLRRALFSVALQEAPALAGSIADNLSLARPNISTTEMWAVLDVACLAEHAASLPDKLDSWVGDGGITLSGGEAKRLALARALLADRPWIILDEPTEGLDATTETQLIEKLSHWLDREKCGAIIITHRPERFIRLKAHDMRLDADDWTPDINRILSCNETLFELTGTVLPQSQLSN